MDVTYKEILEVLRKSFPAGTIDLVDQSAMHAGHAGAMQTGGGHYALLIVSKEFEGKNLVERHQAVYKALEGKLTQDFHALVIKAYTPEEWDNKRSKPSSDFNILPS